MCFSHPQNLLAGWAGPTVAAGYAKIWDDFAAAWRARKGDDGSQGPRPSLVQWVARQTEDLPEAMRPFARAAQLRRLEIDGGCVIEWDELPEFVKTALEASTYDKMLFDSPLQAYLSLSGLASTTSQGREMLALIAPGESFSDEEDARTNVRGGEADCVGAAQRFPARVAQGYRAAHAAALSVLREPPRRACCGSDGFRR